MERTQDLGIPRTGRDLLGGPPHAMPAFASGATDAATNSALESAKPVGRVLWDELLAGRWSLIEAFTTAGLRHVVACRTPAAEVRRQALCPRERSVLDHALGGESNKWIALELRVSESTITRTLESALCRIGVAHMSALVGVRTARFEPVNGSTSRTELAMARLTCGAAWAILSDAERSIVTGLLDGKRVVAIARERGTSPRTVSNQIASAYRKLGVSSVRGVIALLA
jgi:DNA-binding NarL/FixJ family response regulator